MRVNAEMLGAPGRLVTQTDAINDWHQHSGTTDLLVGLRSTHVWSALGWHDIRQRYRRSVIGPFWFTLSTLIMVGVLGVLYSQLLGQEITDYLPFLGVGLVIWQYMSTVLNEGATGFIGSAYLIKQIRMPLTIHVARVVWRNFVIMLHSLPVMLAFLLAFGHELSLSMLVALPGLLLLFLNGIWVTAVLAILCARFRDVLPIVGNLVQVAFFFTPVMWHPDLLKDRAWVAELNPAYHLIELVRAPLLGESIPLTTWAWSLGMLVVGFGMAQYLMRKCRDRVPYWV